MIPEAGHFSLILALVVALIQSSVPLLGVRYNKPGWMALAPRAAVLLFFLLTFSFAALLHAYAVSDFSVKSAAMNSHTMMPFIYKLAAAWGNHEGSMLLWVWMLALWGALAAGRRKNLGAGFLARALAIEGMIGAGFLAFILFTSNPFLRLDPPAEEGLGLNPVLQDPALAIHPPLLYTGYVGFSVAFCFAMAALLENKVDRRWAAAVRPWILVAWAALTAGIVKGSIWAYYELGWGGFWFWDPVENASLMPWLCGAALLHAVAVLEKRDTLKGWTVFLSILAFSFSLLGTFLVRSGILTSVHSFAVDPARGVFILALLVAAIGGAFLLYAFRAPSVKPGASFRPFSRETFMLLNNVFLFTFCATVFMGTLYPVFMNALGLGGVSVGPPYYSATLVPMLAPFALLMGAAPYIAWQRGEAASLKKLAAPFLLTALSLLLPGFLTLPHQPLALFGYAVGGWVLWTMLCDLFRKGRGMPLSYYGMVTAHIGFAVFIIGVAAVTQGTQEKILWMAPGMQADIAGRSLTFLGAETELGPDYNVERGVFMVKSGNAKPFFLAPEKRWYPVAEKETGETALHADFSGMLYLALGERDKASPGRRVVRAYYHPLILLVFGGGFLMYIGGLVSALDRKRRAKDA